ncbi:MAG: putative toxin-antitoxin system toxin component, PIN family [Defluviitaleaceae bacterium]|nr:putative toxin-antitoxin system toxin component, PIN family [Defluviitaleaceae bacterium]
MDNKIINKIVMDTNVIVSAFISPNGNPAKILTMFTKSQVQAFYNAEILKEYETVIKRPHFKFSEEKIRKFFQDIEILGFYCQPQKSTIPLPDETDRCFYDVAKTCNAWLITGNGKHYPKESFVIAPTEFLILQQPANSTII